MTYGFLLEALKKISELVHLRPISKGGFFGSVLTDYIAKNSVLKLHSLKIVHPS